MTFDAVLSRECRRDRGFAGAEVPVRCQDGVRALREARFEARDRSVGDRFEAGVGDAFLDVGLAVQVDLDHRAAFIGLQQEHDIGERRTTVRDEDRRARRAGRSGSG